MAKLTLLTKTGQKSSKEQSISDVVFGQEVNQHLLYLAKVRQESNARGGNAHSKTRPEVRGGGAKPWKQKGTGRARAGSSNSPLWRGGGVIFGPRNYVNWTKGMNRKESALALVSALSLAARQERLQAIETIEVTRTSELAKLVNESGNAGKKVLFVIENNNPNHTNLSQAARNLVKSKLISVAELNIKDLLKAENIIISSKAIEQIEERFATSTKEAA
jgi:large subunit ribosomal protein L4